LFGLVLRLRDAEAADIATRRRGQPKDYVSPQAAALAALRGVVVTRVRTTPDTLACQAVCAPHMRAYLAAHPLDAATLTSEQLLQWLRGLRRDVDARAGRARPAQ